MMEPEDKEYYKQRATRERQIADECKDQSIASVHRNLAKEYEKRSDGEPTKLKVARDP